MASDNRASAALVALLYIPIGILINTAVLATLWGWFVVPLGVEAIGKAHAMGIATLFGFLSHSDKTKTEDKDPIDTVATMVITSLTRAGFTLFLAWIAKGLM